MGVRISIKAGGFLLRVITSIVAIACCIEMMASPNADGRIEPTDSSISRIVGDPNPDPVVLGALLDKLAAENLSTRLRVCRCIPQDRTTTILSTVAEYRHLDGIAIKLMGYKLRILPRLDKPAPVTPVREIMFFVSHDFNGDCQTLMYVGIRSRDTVPSMPPEPGSHPRFVYTDEILYHLYLLSGDEAHLSRIPCGRSENGDTL